MLDVTHSRVDVETEFGMVSLILLFLKFLLQTWFLEFWKFLETAKKLLNASLRHLSSLVYCKKGHCLDASV